MASRPDSMTTFFCLPISNLEKFICRSSFFFYLTNVVFEMNPIKILELLILLQRLNPSSLVQNIVSFINLKLGEIFLKLIFSSNACHYSLIEDDVDIFCLSSLNHFSTFFWDHKLHYYGTTMTCKLRTCKNIVLVLYDRRL